MFPALSFKDKHVALFGLGGSGLVTAQSLVAGGAQVVVWDDNENARAKASAAGLSVANLADADWSKFNSFVLSPGVPLTHPKPHWTVDKAKAAGVEIIGDIEIFCRERALRAPHAPFVAITGTNGKSTTTALIAHLFKHFGFDVQLGGNIGVPVLALEAPDNARVHVVECSTFQIDLAPSLNPSVGLLMNLTPDHLDRHGTMENYAAIKERLVAQSDHAVVCLDDEYCVAVGQRLDAAQVLTTFVAVTHELAEGIILRGKKLIKRHARMEKVLGDLAGIPSLRGKHNGQNAAAAVAAVREVVPDLSTLQAGLSSFPGLAHRMQEIAREGKILFVNDSKATNADAAEKALLAFRDIFWIIGGKSKEGGIAPLEPLFSHVAKAFLIGAASDEFAATLDGKVPYERCGTMDVAVASATRDARASTAQEPVVLLSPACASYDQFPNFEVRGDAFVALVNGIVQPNG